MTDPVAYAADGGTVVVGDGPELLVYRSDGAPAYKLFLDGILAGVGVYVDQVITVDGDGRVCWHNRGNGEVLHEIRLDAAPTGLAVASDGALAVLTSQGVWIVRRGQVPRFVGVQGATAVCWGPDSGSMGVGTGSGSFAAIDPITGVAWGTVSLGAAIEGCGWSVLGEWVVTAGTQLALVQGDGAEITRVLPDEGPLGPVAVSSDGILVAAVCGTDVAVFELNQLSRCGELAFRRALTDVVFGPGHHLCIGMDDGDATMVEVVSGTPSRTEPHPGRGRNTWRMDNKVERDRLRGAVARHRAGGEPIARWVGPKEDESAASEGSGCWQSAAIVGCVTVLTTVLCSGAVGVAWYLQQQGYF
jgi:hypothetical protein